MTNLVLYSHDVEKLAEPKSTRPVVPELISGDPVFRSWVQDVSFDGKVRSGVWEASPGLTQCIKLTTYEYCFILEGVVEITESDGGTSVFRQGDAFGFKPGFTGTWKTLETVRKFFVSVTL